MAKLNKETKTTSDGLLKREFQSGVPRNAGSIKRAVTTIRMPRGEILEAGLRSTSVAALLSGPIRV